MTEIPEHLRKRAEEARKKAAAAKAGGADAPAAAETGGAPRPTRRRARPPAASPPTCSSASKAAKAGQRAATPAAAAPPPRWPPRRRRPPAAAAGPAAGRRPGRSHPAPAHGRQVRLDPGRQGRPAGQGPRLAPPARRRVRRRPGLHRLPAVFSIFVNAPLLALANVNQTPNPSKAPWYFLGLQELLTMFHPMVAGVTIPGIGLFGLILAPYIDRNPSNKPEDRKFAISLFTIFLMFWAVLVHHRLVLPGPGLQLRVPLERRPVLRAVIGRET